MEDDNRPAAADPPDFVWWKHGVIYQVYPRSFQDTNGDGVGDLEGVISRLDYLADLGVDAIWLSPIFCSPMDDFGYDVSDHTAIDPLFGDLATFARLIDEAHRRGLKVILDYIPNHTSDRHPWFQASRASLERRDWYVWSDPAPDGGPPNNWRSEFGGPAWTWDEAGGQYYYHAFLPSQPDLNWRNREVVEAMLGVLDVWLERGVDGFRVDAIHHLFEHPDLPDNPPNPDWAPDQPPAEKLLRLHTVDQPEVHAAVADMRRRVDAARGDGVLIGEAYLPIPRLMAYYGVALDGFHLPFNFHLMSTPWNPRAVADLVRAYEAHLPPGGWPNWVLSNHDRSRLASRLGRDQARVAAMLLLTLRGTPTLYQGDELGMTDVDIPPDRVCDPFGIAVPGLGRDPARTPMLWSAAANAGFSHHEPWLPLSPDWREVNVSRQVETPGSILRFYQRLLRLRRREPALFAGDYAEVAVTDHLLAFERRLGEDRALVVLDLGGRGGRLDFSGGEILCSTRPGREGESLDAAVDLAANEGLIIRPSSPLGRATTTAQKADTGAGG